MIDMAQTVTSAATTTGSKFPFVRVPMFELLGSQTRASTGTEMITWAPLVTESERMEWSNFTTKEQSWYNESIDLVKISAEDDLKPLNYNPNATLVDVIYTETETGNSAVPGPGPFTPIWQCSPPPFSLSFINYNLLNDVYFQAMLPSIMFVQDGLISAVLPRVVRLAGIFITPEDHEASHLTHIKSVNGNSTFNHPHSVHLQPVYKNLKDHNSRVVGVLLSLIAWDTFMSNLLPDGVTGIVAVLQNTCNQSFTYFLDGIQVSQRQPQHQMFCE
jgi:hypothetical protein